MKVSEFGLNLCHFYKTSRRSPGSVSLQSSHKKIRHSLLVSVNHWWLHK